MRYMYGVTDDKFVDSNNKPAKDTSPLSIYKFNVPAELEGLKRIPKSRVPRRLWATPDTLVELSGNVVNEIPLPEAFKWTNVDVTKWLEKLGFPQYRNTFHENFINGRTLLLVNESALQAMNITRFDHIKAITQAIRDLYKVEFILFNRSISLPPRYPGTHYKFYRVQTGLKYELTRPTDLWRKMKILREPPTYENHWTTLENWLKHIPNYQKERVAYAPRRNLYKVKKAPAKSAKTELPQMPCKCLPPCEYNWTEKDTRLPWRLELLDKYLDMDDDDLYMCVLNSGEEEEKSEGEVEGEDLHPEEVSGGLREKDYTHSKSCDCIPPCECDWHEDDYRESWALTILKVKYARRYTLDTSFVKFVTIDNHLLK